MRKLMYLIFGIIVFTSCAENTTEEETETVIKQAPVELAPAGDSPEFEGATLKIASTTATQADGKVKVQFNFDVENYELMSQTADVDAKMCANSEKGQHIHFILDNEPYAALYEPTHEVTLEKNSEHWLMAFLSRSYHESVKSEGASLVFHFKIDENGKVQELEAPTQPMLFYSRPKGDYIGEANTTKLLFDFFVWNAELGNNGYKVKANINADGIDTTMMIDDWQSYFLSHIPLGKPNITLTLVDADGNKVDGPMTEVTREFTLSADEPIAN